MSILWVSEESVEVVRSAPRDAQHLVEVIAKHAVEVHLSQSCEEIVTAVKACPRTTHA